VTLVAELKGTSAAAGVSTGRTDDKCGREFSKRMLVKPAGLNAWGRSCGEALHAWAINFFISHPAAAAAD
jgi:hypothetical protein